jgi:hypothetical protein
MKDEKYIKGLLQKVFSGVGNFQQCEFTSFGGSSRPDFVILDNDYFKYFEIKAETDNFLRLAGQVTNAVGVFTHLYMVVPMNKVMKLKDQNWAGGIYTVEDLEEGKIEPFQEQEYPWRPSIKKLAKLLWSNELKNYIKDIKPDMFIIDNWNGNKKKISQMNMNDLYSLFPLFYSDGDSLKILNEVLPNRKYDFRESRQNKLI